MSPQAVARLLEKGGIKRAMSILLSHHPHEIPEALERVSERRLHRMWAHSAARQLMLDVKHAESWMNRLSDEAVRHGLKSENRTVIVHCLRQVISRQRVTLYPDLLQHSPQLYKTLLDDRIDGPKFKQLDPRLQALLARQAFDWMTSDDEGVFWRQGRYFLLTHNEWGFSSGNHPFHALSSKE